MDWCNRFVLQLMKRLKQIVLFLLVVITIYSTMLFYLLMSVHADSRLQEIDYLEKTKPQIPNKVLYIDRLVPLNQRIKHFSVSRVSHKEAKPTGCEWKEPRQAVLLIAASSFDTINIYSKVLRQLQVSFHDNCVPEVFVMKRLRSLILNNQQNINKYAYEIGQVLKYFTIEAEMELSIFTHEEGALLTLIYLVRKNINLLFHNVIQKIRSILFVDITHPFLRIQYDPPYKLLHKLKLEIFLQKQRVRIFNKLKFVIVTTHKQDTLAEHFFYRITSQKVVFAKTLLISSRQMANVHYFLPPNSLSFPPLVRRLAHFIAKDFVANMTVGEISTFLRYGQSYPYEKKEEKQFQQCSQFSLAKAEYIHMLGKCIKLSPLMLGEEEIVLMYSSHHFEVYASNYERMYPFDNLTEGSIFMFERMTNPLYIVNTEDVDIMISKQKIANPKIPLKLNQQQMLYASQLLFSNYSVVRICPNTLLTFPLHFAQGNIHRKFLGEGEEKCFVQSSVFQNFSWELFLNWSLFRNMVIFTLMCSQFRRQSVSDRLIEQFFINMLLLLTKEQIESKITCGIYIVAFSILVEYLNRVILYLVSFFTLKQSWASFALLAISVVCVFGSIFSLFNYWKIFAIAIIFFINKESLTIFLLKMYFLKEEFPLNTVGYQGLTDLGLLTMWLYTSLSVNQPVTFSESTWSADQVFTALLLFGLALGVQWSGSSIETMLTIYMKLLIVLRMLRILRK